METPVSIRRVTRSQTRATMNKTTPIVMIRSNMNEKNEFKQSNEKRDRSALINITNGSPIAGIAMENLMKSPSSLLCSKKKINLSTSCSGETLLRGQVKTLLMNKKNMFQFEEEEDGNNHELPEFCFDEHPLLKTTSLPTQVTQGRVMKMDASEKEVNVNDRSKKRLRTRSLLFDFYTEKYQKRRKECVKGEPDEV